MAVEQLVIDAAKQLDQQFGLSEGAAVAASLLRSSAQTAVTSASAKVAWAIYPLRFYSLTKWQLKIQQSEEVLNQLNKQLEMLEIQSKVPINCVFY